MNNTALKIKNVFVRLNELVVLENINLEIQEREFLGIIGPNGGGKTTLLKTIIGLIEPDEGSITILGEPIKKGKKFIGYIPQYAHFDINYPISVFDTVSLGRLGLRSLGGRLNENDKSVVRESLKIVGLEGYEKRIVGKLSGGEKQRVLIARALSVKPKILILDEPTASIDSKTNENFYELLRKLNEDITIIIVSHDIGAISAYVKKIACLNKNLIFHDSKELSPEMLEKTYHCPIDLIAHGVPHRVLHNH